MRPIHSILITGANAGLGREAARQLALQKGIEKIYLGCRSAEKAAAARAALEAETGRAIFDIVSIDVADKASVRAAVGALAAPVDAVILNAGGTGGRSPGRLTDAGVTRIYAANLLGHAVLVDELLTRQLVTSTVLYAGSETARGVPRMGIARPDLDHASVDAFAAIADGRRFGADGDPFAMYAAVKRMAALWMGAMARRYPHIRFVTMSPGGTTGTNGMDDLPFMKKLFFKHVGSLLMPLLGMMHSVDVGARRYVDGLLNASFESGRFYASAGGAPTGPVIDQARIDADLGNPAFQDNAALAVERFA